MEKKSIRSLITVFVAVLLLSGTHTRSEQPDSDKVIIKITAQMFEYSPSRIHHLQ